MLNLPKTAQPTEQNHFNTHINCFTIFYFYASFLLISSLHFHIHFPSPSIPIPAFDRTICFSTYFKDSHVGTSRAQYFSEI